MSETINALSKEIVDVLIKHNIVPSSTEYDAVESVYDVRELIAEHDSDKIFGVWVEDIGTEDDAGEDYEEILQMFSSRSDGKVTFDNLQSQTDGDNVTLTFSFNGLEKKWEFEQESDHLSSEFLNNLLNIQKENNDGMFVSLLNDDMPEFYFVPSEVFAVLTKHEAITVPYEY
ncbi:hypothetical protein CXF85_12070 [Colwellia sp. 75C3]|uniref:hypothetical protein n=1 Tax=Colwellia sp. 75C3 TaxID=888425 RepID=UPI000C34CD5F|nr:hypothetical protein [Colwellia sp. 75C3]PKG82864.1 hypothetical protein CXF85_12070 [Colwellia sp. 75C3]